MKMRYLPSQLVWKEFMLFTGITEKCLFLLIIKWSMIKDTTFLEFVKNLCLVVKICILWELQIISDNYIILYNNLRKLMVALLGETYFFSFCPSQKFGFKKYSKFDLDSCKIIKSQISPHFDNKSYQKITWMQTGY